MVRVAGFSASEKVAVGEMERVTPVAPGEGVRETIVGGVVSLPPGAGGEGPADVGGERVAGHVLDAGGAALDGGV